MVTMTLFKKKNPQGLSISLVPPPCVSNVESSRHHSCIASCMFALCAYAFDSASPVVFAMAFVFPLAVAASHL